MAATTGHPLIPTAKIGQAAFCSTEDGLPSKFLAREPSVYVSWKPIPRQYLWCKGCRSGRPSSEGRAFYQGA